MAKFRSGGIYSAETVKPLFPGKALYQFFRPMDMVMNMYICLKDVSVTRTTTFTYDTTPIGWAQTKRK